MSRRKRPRASKGRDRAKKGAGRPKGARGLPGWLVAVGLAVGLLGLGLWWRQGSNGVGAEVQTAREDRTARSGADEVGKPGRHLAERRDVRVVRVLPHDPEAFTQGLLWWHGSLWESTGQYGHSDVRQVDPETGEVLRRATLTPDLFGEGLARVGQRLFQLTWREDTALRWTLPNLEPDGRLSYAGEGWGLCFDGEHLVWSDGSDRLRFVKPEDFAVVREQPVTLDGRPLRQLNELECVGDRVWANVWTTDLLVEIDPATGRVETRVNAAGLLTREERRRTDVLNGIAYRPETGTYFITGKLWPKMFEVRLDAEEIPGSSPAEIE